jgi:Tol biopolymer transport system component
MVTTAGGASSLRPDGLHRITTGRVEAVGTTGWLVVECDRANHCYQAVVDRATGKRRHLPGQINTDFPTPGLISPDGSRALVVGMDDGFPGVWLVDLDSGQRHSVDVYPRGRTFLGPGSAAWSPDSRWLLLADDRGVLVAINAHTRAVHRLKIDLPDIDQVAVSRPS